MRWLWHSGPRPRPRVGRHAAECVLVVCTFALLAHVPGALEEEDVEYSDAFLDWATNRGVAAHVPMRIVWLEEEWRYGLFVLEDVEPNEVLLGVSERAMIWVHDELARVGVLDAARAALAPHMADVPAGADEHEEVLGALMLLVHRSKRRHTMYHDTLPEVLHAPELAPEAWDGAWRGARAFARARIDTLFDALTPTALPLLRRMWTRDSFAWAVACARGTMRRVRFRSGGGFAPLLDLAARSCATANYEGEAHGEHTRGLLVVTPAGMRAGQRVLVQTDVMGIEALHMHGALPVGPSCALIRPFGAGAVWSHSVGSVRVTAELLDALREAYGASTGHLGGELGALQALVHETERTASEYVSKWAVEGEGDFAASVHAATRAVETLVESVHIEARALWREALGDVESGRPVRMGGDPGEDPRYRWRAFNREWLERHGVWHEGVTEEYKNMRREAWVRDTYGGGAIGVQRVKP